MSSAVSSLAGFSAEKRRVALHSMLAAAAMTLLKLAAGLVSGSLGVLSDAAHSALDLAGAALTFFSVRVSDKPADEDHTYGHGKIENISSLAEAGLMVDLLRVDHLGSRRAHSERRRRDCTTPSGRCWCCSLPSPSISGDRASCAQLRSGPARRRWRPTRSTSPPISGRRSPCLPDWAPVGWARCSTFLAAPGRPRRGHRRFR